MPKKLFNNKEVMQIVKEAQEKYPPDRLPDVLAFEFRKYYYDLHGKKELIEKALHWHGKQNCTLEETARLCGVSTSHIRQIVKGTLL